MNDNHHYEYDEITESDSHFREMEEDFDRIMEANGMRTAPTGATRDELHNKLEYFKFFSIRSMKEYADYMHGKRYQNDGTIRDAANWAKGMPRDWYADSMGRHFMDIMYHHQGAPELAEEELKIALVAMLFNVQAYLHEVLIGRDVKDGE